jgi:iron complex outermembrane receptor protein
MKHIYLCATASVLVSMAPTAAYAQTTPPAPQPAADGEIIVTAQRRNESLRDVPIAVTAIDSQLAERLNLRNIDNLQIVTPGLTFNRGTGYVQSFIRGVGSNFPNPGLESAVATYVDGAYLESSFGSVFELLDAGVQVLKGPQGTLYGRNATGGAILITSNAPTDKFEGYAVGEYGRFDHALGEAVVNLPLNQDFALRVAGRYVSDGGYGTNRFDGKEIYNRHAATVRGTLAYNPTESDFSARLIVNHIDSSDNVSASRQILEAPNCAACAIPGSGVPVDDFYDTNINFAKPVKTKVTSGNLRLAIDTDNVKVESITAYSRQRTTGGSDLDYSPFPLFALSPSNLSKTFTQELQVSSSVTPWADVLFGVSYLHDTTQSNWLIEGAPFDPLVVATGEDVTSNNRIKTESASAYGEFTLTPVENLRLTAGGRYTYDKRTLDAVLSTSAYLALSGGVGLLTNRQTTHTGSFTPRFVAAYDLGPVNIYGSYNKGFKSGGYSTPPFALPAPSVEPEKIESYEVGAKFVSADRKVRFNIAAFRYNYDNVQVTIIDLSKGGAVIQNAASARGKGVEADASFRPAEWLELIGGGSYLDAKYRDFPNGSVNVPTPTGLVAGTEDLSGFPLVRSPKWTGFIGANVNATIGDDWKLGLNAIARYSSKYDFVPGAGGPLRLDRQPGFTLVNVGANIGPADERFQIGVFIDNLTNKKYSLTVQTAAPFGAQAQAARPRMIGGRVRVNF